MLGAGSARGASAVTLATSYAVGDYFDLRNSLHCPWREARTFHRSYAAAYPAEQPGRPPVVYLVRCPPPWPASAVAVSGS